MHRKPRKTTPRVKGGKVQRKNRTDLSPHYSLAEPGQPIVERHKPGHGYRHLLLKRHVEEFLGLLPDWEELSKGLKAVLLTPGEEDCLGWHTPGIVAVCAWERHLAGSWNKSFVQGHASLIEQLKIRCQPDPDGSFYLYWTESSIRAFQLLHVLLHELGHHHDRMTTSGKRRSSRGESYAEYYANEHAERIWTRYLDVFGDL